MKVILDPEDEHLFDGFKITYSGRYPTINKDSRTIRVHEVVVGKAPVGLETDHINRNKLDNRKSNLRFITHADNLRNRNGWSKSKLKGADLDKSRKNRQWKSEIRIYGKKYCLGYFETAEQAHRAYLSKLTTINL